MLDETVTIGVAQWQAALGDGQTNLRTALAVVAELARRESDLVVLPELWASGYEAARLAEIVHATAEPLDGPRGQALSRAAHEHGLWLLAGTVPEAPPDSAGRIYNTAVLYDPAGRIAGRHRKAHLYRPTGEHEVFAPGDEPTVIDTPAFGLVGIATCFDGDHPGYARALRQRGARLVLMPAAYETGAERWWELLYPANALANGQWWVTVNQCGGDGPSGMFGRSRIIAPDGEIVAEAPRVGEGPGPHLLTCTIDLHGRARRAEEENSALWLESRPEIYPA